MAKTLQFRRDTTSNLSGVTPAAGELFVDTTKKTVIVGDGSTAGGFPLQSELVSATNIKTVNGTSLLGSGDITISGGSGGGLSDGGTANTLTIGTIYYANNIVSPIPTVANTSYGTIITVPPLVINGPLNVLSADTPNTTTVLTLSGSQTSGGNSGGTNNFGTKYVGNVVSLSFNNLGNTVYNALGLIKSGDVLTIIGTNGIFTGTFNFTVSRVTRTFVGAGDFPGWAVIYGTTADSRGSRSGFNANTIICNRPYIVSAFTGGLTTQHLTASQVVGDNLKATKSLDVEGILSSSITEKRGLAASQLYTNTTNTNLILSSNQADVFNVSLITNGSSKVLNHLYLSTPWAGGETSERTITVKIGTYGDNNCSWNFSASDAVYITQYTEDGLDSNYQTAPIVWKNGTKTGTFTLGRTYYMTLKVFNGASYVEQILASIDEYY